MIGYSVPQPRPPSRTRAGLRLTPRPVPLLLCDWSPEPPPRPTSHAPRRSMIGPSALPPRLIFRGQCRTRLPGSAHRLHPTPLPLCDWSLRSRAPPRPPPRALGTPRRPLAVGLSGRAGPVVQLWSWGSRAAELW